MAWAVNQQSGKVDFPALALINYIGTYPKKRVAYS